MKGSGHSYFLSWGGTKFFTRNHDLSISERMAYLGCHLYNENNDDIIKPATDVFEINDFTAATEWENFIDDIENILRNWRICELEPSADMKVTFYVI